jgi:hypothetical protein
VVHTLLKFLGSEGQSVAERAASYLSLRETEHLLRSGYNFEVFVL